MSLRASREHGRVDELLTVYDRLVWVVFLQGRVLSTVVCELVSSLMLLAVLWDMSSLDGFKSP